MAPKKPSDGKTSALLRVVTPYAMGAGSSLYVDCSRSTYLVKILGGTTIEAKGHRESAITGDWRDGLFDCLQPTEGNFCVSTDGNFCALAFCVPIIALGCLMEPLKMDCFYQRNSPFPSSSYLASCASSLSSTPLSTFRSREQCTTQLLQQHQSSQSRPSSGSPPRSALVCRFSFCGGATLYSHEVQDSWNLLLGLFVRLLLRMLFGSTDLSSHEGQWR